MLGEGTAFPQSALGDSRSLQLSFLLDPTGFVAFCMLQNVEWGLSHSSEDGKTGF